MSSNSSKVTDTFKQAKKGPRFHHGKENKKDDAVSSATSYSHIHLEPGANPDLEALKQFDLCLEFGPCTGITRLQRWERAEKHRLNPPAKVKEILLKHPTDANYTQSLWKDYNI